MNGTTLAMLFDRPSMTPTRFTTLLLVALSLSIARPASVSAHSTDALLAQSDAVPGAARPNTLTGTVHALVVDDPIRGTSMRHVELELADGSLVPLRGDGTSTFATGARATVSGGYDGKSFDVASGRTVAASTSVPKANAEIDGTLAILHADDFAHGKSSFVYEIQQWSGKVNRLRLGSLPATLAPGMRLRVTGRAEADGESVTPEHITVLAEPTSANEANAAIAEAATANSVLVILANFNNTVAPAFSAAQAQAVMTSNGDSVASFFRETSYGQQLMNVTVTPSWVKMNMARPATCGTADWQNVGSSAEAAARSLGAAYDPAGYQFVVYLFPTLSSCGWLGLAYIGYPHKSWINGTESFFTSAIAHEIGHNFGLLHAASLRCGSAIIGGNCTASEYGDPFDTMGNQRAMHYNAMQKSKLGWIGSTTVQTYAGGSATYTLTPLEVAGGTTYAVRIPTGSANRTYWVEFRQPIGFDSPLASFPNNGAQIRVASPFETYCPGCDSYSDDTELIDATPTTSTFNDATLVAGNTFKDPNYGINVTVLSASASAMTVQVSNAASPPPPASTPTTTTLAASANPALVGTNIAFTAFVTGNAPSGTVQFIADGATIAGCGAVPLTGGSAAATLRRGSVSSPPTSVHASCATSALVAGTHAIVARYAGDSSNAASTSAVLSEVV
ncbi:MAG TPA: Ig-like domain repeat protein, partial [Casimicrobiaceae bacterium]|nr:Ig-like domain repeat protein [Casimicrobiaceae bacterium]